MSKRIDRLARQALAYAPEERQIFLGTACDTSDLRDAVRERIAELDAEEATETALPPTKAKTLPDDQAETLPDDQAETLPDDQAKTLPDDQAETLPDDEAETLPDDEAETLPDDEAETLPDDEAETLPDDEAETLPDDEATRTQTAPVVEDERTETQDGAKRPSAFATSPFGQKPERVGPWRLVRMLGRGGMGAVYLAERDDGQFQQRAALKLIRHDLGHAAQERFLSERQILAQLQHPNIAHLLDGGVTDDGRPYFAMEYVDGTPLTAYCNAHGVDVETRLRLFQQVCEAVQFAHRNLIVHRDLKPGNILVAEGGTRTTTGTHTGAGPRVKLLDFGIAKALEGADAGTATLTRTGEGGPMTPSYAAPEQIEGAAITTATDVYALGVVLCELLTGALPYDIRGRSVVEAAQIIVNKSPERLSQRVVTSLSEDVAEAYDVSADTLRRMLRGDLDVIVEKALRKEPERRYTSAAELGQDIGRYLDGLPVEARPATTGYRVRRFVARNRAAVFGATGAVLALIIGLGVAVWQGQVAAAERDRAQQQATRAEAVQTFLVDMIERAAPAVTGGEALTVRDVLDEADAELGGASLREEPAVRMEVRMTLSQMYRLLGQAEGAIRQGKEAYETGLADFGPTHPITLQAAGAYGHAMLRAGKIPQADSLYRIVIPRLDATTVSPAVRFSLLSKYGEVLRHRSQLDSAEVVLRRSLEWYDRMETPDTLGFTTAISALGGVYRRQGRIEDAEAQYRKALAISEERASEDRKPAIAILANNLANLHRQQEELAEAERMFRRSLRLSTTLFGETSGNVAAISTNLSRVLQLRGKLAEADSMSRRSVALHRELFPPADYRIGFALSVRMQVLMEQGRFEAARTAGDEALRLFRENLGPQHPRTTSTLADLATVCRRLGLLEDAATYSAKALEAQRTRLDGDDPSVIATRVQLGGIRSEQGRHDEAEELLLRAHRALEGDSLPDLRRRVRSQLAAVYEAQGRPDAARRWQSGAP